MLFWRLLICFALLAKIISGAIVLGYSTVTSTQIICRCAKFSQMQLLQLIFNDPKNVLKRGLLPLKGSNV